MAAFPTASKPKIHVIPSKTLQANAILVCEIINTVSIIGFFFSSLLDNFFAFNLPCRYRLYITFVNVTVLANRMAATGITTAI